MSEGSRRWELDALRGVMLVAMTLTHLPTRFSDPAGQPLGYVSAAEGFVMLSAYIAGSVYTRRRQRSGAVEMRGAFVRRAVKIYLCQAGLLLFAFSVVAGIGVFVQQPAVTDLLSFYLEHPLRAFVAGALLVYNPPLLDILPLYVVFMLVSPVLLLHGLRHGWTGLMAGSLLLWLGAQFGLGTAAYDLAASLTHLSVPRTETGAFSLLAWQFLWMLGLWMGSQSAAAPAAPPLRFPAWMVRTALAYALLCLVWRHAVGQAPAPGHDAVNLLFDKWSLGPLRLLDFMALLLLTVHHAEWLGTHLPRWRALETLGAASLPVFCAHLVLALMALALFGAATPERPLALDLAILLVVFVALWGVARLSVAVDRRATAVRQRFSARST